MSRESLIEEIAELLRNSEGSAILQRDSDDYLLFGVEGDLGFVHYDPGSKGGNYLWIKDPELENREEEYIGFNVGGTETEIDKKRCFDKADILKVAIDFYEHGKLTEAVWEIDEV